MCFFLLHWYIIDNGNFQYYNVNIIDNGYFGFDRQFQALHSLSAMLDVHKSEWDWYQFYCFIKKNRIILVKGQSWGTHYQCSYSLSFSASNNLCHIFNFDDSVFGDANIDCYNSRLTLLLMWSLCDNNCSIGTVTNEWQ